MFEGPLNTPYLHRFFDDAKARLAKVDPSGPLPDRYVQSNYEAMNALKVGMEKSKFQGRDDTTKLIDALEGLEMKESDDFPQGDKTLRKEDHQAFLREFIFEVEGGTYQTSRDGGQGQDHRSAGLHVLCVSARRTFDSTQRSPASDRGAASAPILKTELLSVRFGGLAALSEVNFEVARGEVRAIIGPNGAGKSTFFNCLTGVLRPTGGRIIFNGEDITGLPSNAISQKGIARSYQITNILPNATVLENVRIAAQSRRHGWNMIAHHGAFADINNKAEAALQSVGLLGKAEELAANLSHGEQRNLEIGIALATEPQLLCLDEPTAGMSAGRDRRDHGTGAPHRQEPHHPDRRARHGGGDGALRPHHRAALRRDPRRRHAGGNPAEPEGAGGLSQDMSACRRRQRRAARPWSRTCTPITARATSCTASRSRSAPARWSACSAATASAKARR